MPWVRLDDHFDEHPKIASVGPLGLALWVTALAYCNRNLTDGFIPWTKARSLVAWEYQDADGKLYTVARTTGHVGDDVSAPHVIDLLVDAGLWEIVDDGYQIHDYADYQPLKAEIEAAREQKVEAGRRGGQARAKQSPKHVLEQSLDSRSSETLAELKPVSDPDPTSVSDPDPTPEPQQRRFQPNPSSIRTRLWEVYTDLTSRLTPPTYEEEQIQHWEELGCSEEHIEAALRAVADANPEKRWPFFKARLGEALVKSTQHEQQPPSTRTVRIVR